MKDERRKTKSENAEVAAAHRQDADATGRGEEFAPGEIEGAVAAFDRRTFLKVMGASLAAAGMAELGACSKPQPLEKIVPYVSSPEHVVPGVPVFYASSLPTRGFASGYGRGVVVETHEGRPTKIEGNVKHPSSLGATDIFMQAAVLQVYDPGRSMQVLQGGQGSLWSNLLNQLSTLVRQRGGPAGVRLRLLTSTVTSPTVAAQIKRLREVFPQCVWHVEDVLGGTNGGAGVQRVLGKRVTPVYDFTKARRIISLDGHFLGEEPGSLRYAREFAWGQRVVPHAFGANVTHVGEDAGRVAAPDEKSLARLYMAESTLTYTGARATHRVAVRPGMLPAVAAALGRALLGGGRSGGLPEELAAWVVAAAADVRAAGGEALIVAGEYLPVEVHALGHALNGALGGAKAGAVRYVEAVETWPEGDASVGALAKALDGGEVDLLVMLDVNPVFQAPADARFGEALARFGKGRDRTSLHVGAYVDETAVLCKHHVPLSHALEAWGDLRGHDGTVGLVQPLIEPLWGSKSVVEVLAAVASLGVENSRGKQAGSAADLFASGYDLVRQHWMKQWQDMPAGEREMRWRRSLRDGVMEGTAAAEARDVKMAEAAGLFAEVEKLGAGHVESGAMEIVFRPDPSIGDGFWANHTWLQELPKPFSHATWGNVAVIGPRTAERLGIGGGADPGEGPGVHIEAVGQSVEMPVWVQPGHPEEVVTLYLGGGRKEGGAVQKNVGVNVYPLRTTEHLWHRGGVKVEKSTRKYAVGITQAQQDMSGREVARMRGVADFPKGGSGTPDLYSARRDAEGKSVHLSLYDENRYDGYKWGMVIDLSACIGCNACVVACQAENNIPTVGPDQVRRGRAMHWLRIDTYVDAGESGREAVFHFQPMMCQHCENAPCEVVCPVEATSHSEEGINEMTYNRCVGTRYCSNNCPYKVRRFNFYAYSKGASSGVPRDEGALEAMQKNPNVTVRSRGVMEKCTYCIQRINRARIEAKRAWAQSSVPLSVTAARGGPRMREAVADGWLPGGRGRELPEIGIQTACQQACPTEAIVFGDLNDARALVTRLKMQQPWAAINYGVLTDLNTQPRTSYLERVVNGNAALEKRGGAA